MSRRLGTAVLVALIVITAGCLGIPGGDAPASEPSEADDGGTDEGVVGNGGGAGDTDGGTADGAVVANRTAALAAAGSYTSTWRMTVTEDGTVTGETAYVTAIDTTTERSHFRATQTSDGVSTDGWELYYADGVSYSRYGAGEDETYGVTEGVFTGTALFDGTRYVTDSDDLDGFDRAGTETFDGVTVTRYTLTERPAWVAAGQMTEGEIQWTEFTFEVLVDGDGVVRQETWTSTGIDEQDVTHTVEFYSAVTGVGTTTVEEPDWVGTAREQATQ